MPADLPEELVPLTDEQRAVRELCRDFAREVIRPVAREVDEADVEVPLAVWAKAAEVGITSFMLPEQYGGGGVTDVFTQCIAQEELTYGDIAIGNLVTSNGFYADPVLEIGTDEQKERFLTPLCADLPPFTALATTEPEFGSDAGGIQTRAVREGDDYRVNGRKTWISNGGLASSYVVFATTDASLRSRGITAFVVDADSPGLSTGEPFRKMGQRAIRNTELVLDDVVVPAANRLGEEGQGFSGLMRTFDISRVILGASTTGLAQAALDTAVEYAKQREQFGKPIIEHQAVGFRLADVATRVEASRLLTWRAAKRLDAGLDATKEAAMAKLYGSETAMFATWAAVQTLGGWGYSREFLVEKWMRDAKLEEIEEGTSDIQRLIISRRLAR
ncbi:MAG: acyl-CoA dehydrogenase family protein [Actinomycetes bacterium]